MIRKASSIWAFPVRGGRGREKALNVCQYVFGTLAWTVKSKSNELIIKLCFVVQVTKTNITGWNENDWPNKTKCKVCPFQKNLEQAAWEGEPRFWAARDGWDPRSKGRTDGRSGGERRRGWDEQEVVGGAVQMFSKVDRAGSISQEVALVHQQQPASMPKQLINNRQQVWNKRRNENL